MILIRVLKRFEDLCEHVSSEYPLASLLCGAIIIGCFFAGLFFTPY